MSFKFSNGLEVKNSDNSLRDSATKPWNVGSLQTQAGTKPTAGEAARSSARSPANRTLTGEWPDSLELEANEWVAMAVGLASNRSMGTRFA